MLDFGMYVCCVIPLGKILKVYVSYWLKVFFNLLIYCYYVRKGIDMVTKGMVCMRER